MAPSGLVYRRKKLSLARLFDKGIIGPNSMNHDPVGRAKAHDPNSILLAQDQTRYMLVSPGREAQNPNPKQSAPPSFLDKEIGRGLLGGRAHSVAMVGPGSPQQGTTSCSPGTLDNSMGDSAIKNGKFEVLETSRGIGGPEDVEVGEDARDVWR